MGNSTLVSGPFSSSAFSSAFSALATKLWAPRIARVAINLDIGNNQTKNEIQKYYENPQLVLSERALKRRIKVRDSESLVSYDDLPVYFVYIKEIEQTGIQIKQKSRWFNAVSGYINKTQLSQIEILPFVTKIEQVKRFKRIPEPKVEHKDFRINRGA